ncbi:MAG: hypothetical protein JW841_00425 [Deltaproteobacteria bacterium]|nr:hypothetical protein [Deltaproteobacteria bacterium]
MRTTITLDDDVCSSVQELAHRERTSFKKTLNKLLRQALIGIQQPKTQEPKFIIKPHRGGFRPGIDPQKLNQLIDQLQTEDFLGNQNK